MSRRVLLNIDLQACFVKSESEKVVRVINDVLKMNTFDLVIQTQWANNNHSNFVSKLFYKEGMTEKETRLLLSIPGSKILKRHSYSAGTPELARLLRKDDIVYVVGLETDACVLATCFWLFDNGYKFHVVQDGVYSNRKELHTPTLQIMNRNFGKDCLVFSTNLVF